MSLAINCIKRISAKKTLCYNLQNLFVAAAFSMLQLNVFGQKLQFEKDIYNFGQVQYGSESERILTFRNSGTDTLVISPFPTTACGCDMASLQGNKLKYAPNEKGNLIYKFDTKSHRRYNNTITILTNSNPIHSILRVKWEALPESEEKVFGWKEIISDTLKTWKADGEIDLTPHQIDSVILQNPTLKSTLENMERYYCYDCGPYYYRIPVLDFHRNHMCDSLPNILIGHFISNYKPETLFEIARYSRIPYCRIAAMEAYTRSPYSSDCIVSYFKMEHKGTNQYYVKPLSWLYPYNCPLEFMLDIVSPNGKNYNKSYKIDLETYVYLKSMYNYYHDQGTGSVYTSGFISNKMPSFYLHCKELNFGDIDLKYHSKEKISFELRGEIKVYNNSDKTLIITPYRDVNTRFEKKSYNIPVNGFLEIEFWSTVDLSIVNKPMERKIKMVNYKTKEEQIFTFKANFIKK